MFSTGKAIQAGDATLFVAEAGTPDGPSLLFLHGGLGNRHDFTGLARHLAGKYRLVAMDSRGHGSSTLGNEPLTYERLALDAEKVIDALGLVNPVLIGHSDGGIAALRIAAAKRRVLGGLVLLMAHEDPPASALMDGLFARLTPASWRSRFRAGVSHYEKLNPAPDFDRLFEVTRAMWRNTGDGNYPGALVETISCPTLVLGGEADHLAPIDVTLKLARRIHGAGLGILPFGNHVIFQTHPERVAPYVVDFLDMTTKTRNRAPSDAR